MSERAYRRRLRAWGRRQLYSFFSSLGALLAYRLGTLTTVLVLGIAMALPLGLHVALKNLHALDLQQDRWGAVTVFLKLDAGESEARVLAEKLAEQQGASADLVSPQAGMQQFSEASGFGQALEMFEQSPLPWVLHVTPKDSAQAGLEATVAELSSWLEKQENVEFVQVDFKWLRRLEGLIGFGAALVTVLSVLFALAVVVVISNTIRLDVANRAGEIQVLNMVGAPNGYIRQPFLYSGFWYGLMGSLVALLLLYLALFYLRIPLERLLDAYGNTFRVLGLGLAESAGVLAGGGILGLLGSWLAVRRHLRQFQIEEMTRKK